MYHFGDIVCTASIDPLSEAILAAQRSPGEPRSQASHVGIITVEGPLGRAKLVEALWNGVRETPLDRYAGQDKTAAIYRCRSLSPDKLRMVAYKARSMIGIKYGYLKLFAHLGGRYLFRRTLQKTDRLVCSQVVALAFEVVDYGFGVEAMLAQPDDIQDYLREWWEPVGTI